MIDFLMIATRSSKRGVIEIYPKFRIDKRNDLMTRGGDFYAVWDDEQNLWSTDELDVVQMIDKELDKYAEENKAKYPTDQVRVLHMWDAETGMIDVFHKYCQKQLRDQFHQLDEKLIFSNQQTKKRDYASKKLPYPLEEGPTPAFDKLMSTLYSPQERDKIEWAIGSVVSGDSVKLQKFLVLYGAAGTGKSTVLNIIQQLFEGYYAVFDAKALGSSNNSFALEAFKTNPLVAIQHDGDLSRIEDNTRLNSLVSHELMTVNEKFKATYSNRFKCLLFLGTNKPVRITDAKSGLIRRLIDVSPTGDKIPIREYRQLVNQVAFELGPIAWHCREVYLEDPGRYDDYIPTTMLGASNDFYNFVMEYFMAYSTAPGVTLKSAWEDYKQYAQDANVLYPFSQRVFKEELKNYFDDYKERYQLDDGTRVRSYYIGFKTDKFNAYGDEQTTKKKKKPSAPWLSFKEQKSVFDEIAKDYPAQYANASSQPSFKWDNVKTLLKDIDTSKLHYVRVPEHHIVIDFDIPDESGNKSFEKNFEEAIKWPQTYAELSKSGAGIHLHYIYRGDPTKLSRIYSDHIEIKVFTGKSSLRRLLTKCNDIPIATISSGLPLKGEKVVVNQNDFLNEKGLRTFIRRSLNKEYHSATKPSIDFIYAQLEKQYAGGQSYDVSDMKPDVIAFAAGSTNNANYCVSLVNKMHFKSDDKDIQPVTSSAPKEEHEDVDPSDIILFYDVEVFPNLLLINYKRPGDDQPVVRMINPQPEEVRALFRYKLIGFNCRRYDNHILWARANDYSIAEVYDVSKRIIANDRSVFFGQAYNLSYTDIYDFSSKKQSLKKWEIAMGINHLELGLPWDEPVPEEKWEQVAEYCDNDVISTEKLFYYLAGDWSAREMLANISGMIPNSTTNSMTQRIVFGKDKEPWKKFEYRDLGDISQIDPSKHPEGYDEFTQFNSDGRPIFPGYKYDKVATDIPDEENAKPSKKKPKKEVWVSTYRGEEVGEGGWVYSCPGMYGRAVSYDVASMHPSTIIFNNFFGPYTKNFAEIKNTRLMIKHGDLEGAKKMFNGKLKDFLNDREQAKNVSQALKIAINAVYGQTMMNDKYGNPFRDPRNIDNFVAKCGALFMVNLKNLVEDNGYKVIHVKTDSLKVLNPDEKIQKIIFDYGKLYGYDFEIENIFERICLTNDAAYIARLAKDDPEDPGKWHGKAGFNNETIPYAFKKLFSKEEIVFEDMCETKSVDTALYLDLNEGLPEGEHNYRFVGKVGRFTPMKPGCGAGVLLRQATDKDGNVKYDAATGSKGYLWMESAMVKELHLEDFIDRSYYDSQVDELVKDMSQYGDVEAFLSDDREDEIRKAEAEFMEALDIPSPF